MRILREPALASKKILIIDKDDKKKNDRTWCYWEKGEGFFDDIIYRKWEKAWFHGEDYSSLKTLGPYAYKMIRGIDFYEYCHHSIAASPNVDLFLGEITRIANTSEGVHVEAGEKFLPCEICIQQHLAEQSCFEERPLSFAAAFQGVDHRNKDSCFQYR